MADVHDPQAQAIRLDAVEDAIAAIARGEIVVVADDEKGFTRTLLGKMIREIVDRDPTGASGRRLASRNRTR